MSRSGPVGPRILHVGLPKTATTTLQYHLFPQHPQIVYLGKFIRVSRPFTDPAVERVVRRATGGSKVPAGSGRVLDEAIAKAAEMRPDAQAIVLSEETLTVGLRDRRRGAFLLLRELYRPDRVFITLRDPLRLAASTWVQRLQSDNVGLRMRRWRRPRFIELQEWLQRNWAMPEHGELACLDYGRTIDDLTEVFGRDRVGLFVYERLAQDQEEFIRSLCAFIGIDAAPALASLTGKRVNVSMGPDAIDRFRRIVHSPIDSLRFRFLSRRGRMAMLGLSPMGRPQEPGRVELPAEWAAIIADHTRDANRRIAAEYHLPLGDLGYPL